MGIVSSFRDISERKGLEKRLEEHSKNLERLVEERTKKLEEANRLATIGQTAAMVGHDLRNPLQAIISDLYLLRSDLFAELKDKEKVGLKESLDGIEENVEYINKIVGDLQDYARPLKPEAKKIDVDMLCKEVMKSGIPESINVSCNVAEDAKETFFDPGMLKRILNNLVNNAVQAMPNGGKLEVRARQNEGEFVLTVQDTGVGIPDEVKPKLFQPLFTTKSRGQGFGLVVVKRIAEALGGSVSFESEAGKGTTFTVRLPTPSKR
jgi:signal transduction histidine kinase